MNHYGLQLFEQYQDLALKAYHAAQVEDEKGFKLHREQASLILERARKRLTRREFRFFANCTERTLDVLEKCVRLGLLRLERRLAEFKLVEKLSSHLGVASSDQLTEYSNKIRNEPTKRSDSQLAA